MRELDRQNDSFFERLLRQIQTSNVRPFNVGLLNDDGALQFTLQLLLLWIFAVGVTVTFLVLAAPKMFD